MRAVTGLFALSLCSAALAGTAAAQAGTAAPAKKVKAPQSKAAAPAPAAPAAAPAASPEASPPATPAPAAEAPPGPAPQSAPAAPAAPASGEAQPAFPPPSGPPGPPPAAAPPSTPTYGPGNPPPAPPPSQFQYPRLGGKPEPEAEKGDWDPWEHATPDQHNHDGFYLRLAIGIGGGSVWGNDHILSNVRDVSLTGFGFGSSIAIGGAVAENLMLNADFFQAMIFNPAVHQDGRYVGHTTDLSAELGVGDDVGLVGVGVGLTYYFMPVNVYLAGSVGLGQAVFEDSRGSRSGSDLGLGANIMIGKEWWVGSDWGIGVAGQLILVAAHDDILGGLGGSAFNVMFSATYN
ncbi:MAG: hypothetical protein ACHQ53_14815 [Polyangiales bacterium]